MKQINFNDRAVQTLQDNAVAAVKSIESATQINPTTGTTSIQSPFSTGGNLLTGVVLTASQDNLIAHGLGHTPQVWVVCNIDTASLVWSPTTTKLNNQSMNSQYLNLQTIATATVSLWVA